MSIRPVCLCLCLCLVLAAVPASNTRSQQAADDVKDYTMLSDAEKSLVRQFRKRPADIRLPSGPRYGSGPNIGKPDDRSPLDHFLHPDHPRVQPRPEDSTWRRYIKVEPPTDFPKQKRPAEESGNPPIPFKTLPKIKTPDPITVTYVRTPEGIFPKADPFYDTPGTNMLPTIFQNVRDGTGKAMANTLPSMPGDPYHLHEGEPIVTTINPRSPSEDLREVLDATFTLLTGKSPQSLWQEPDQTLMSVLLASVTGHERRIKENATLLKYNLQRAIDIIEGKPVPDRAYSGFPLFHHSGHKRVKRVMPVLGPDGNVIGGNVRVHQIWFDGRIESDTMFFDFDGTYDPSGSTLQAIPPGKSWTITYTVDVLHRGTDDFATTTMFFESQKATNDFFNNMKSTLSDEILQKRKDDCYQTTALIGDAARPDNTAKTENQPLLPHVSMDQTFFPMESGTRTVLTIKMPPREYHNLTYTWGWRFHPPRAQAVENASKQLPLPEGGWKRIVEFEKEVFEKPKDPLFALGDLAPAKRMWWAFRRALKNITDGTPSFQDCLQMVVESRNAYLDWRDRNHLPSGLRPDPESDLTVLFVNNTTYGELTGGGWDEIPKWRTRPKSIRVTLINADYFSHGYLNVDFGGSRGWENQFKSSLKLAGSGTFFSFGRFHYRFNTVPGKVGVPAAVPYKNGVEVTDGSSPDEVKLGIHRLWLEFNHDPSRRLRFYQFDPMHHDVAIYSIH